MKDALSMSVKGIKCDNKDCDYMDMSIPFEEYDRWVNKPCPKCGMNLLTEKDYKTVKAMMNVARFVNKFMPQVEDDTKLATMKVDMDGSGVPKFDIKMVD